MQNNKKSISHKFLYFVNSVFALLLLLAYIFPYVKPELLGSFAALSLLTPLLILINILFVLYWLLKVKRVIFLSLVILLIGFPNLSRLYKLSGKKVLLVDDVKLMSYNVRMFNAYQWIKTDSISHKIDDFISEKSPDILCVQEYSKDSNINFDYKYKYEVFSKQNRKFGHAIFSKFPIIKKGSLNFDNTANNILYADILIDKDTVRVYNVHLESMGVIPNKEGISKENAGKLRQKISKVFLKQQKQVALLLEHQEAVKYPILIAGDFNNTAFSWAYRSLLAGKQDTFVEAGKGFDKTYDYPFPMRIDFILADEQIKVNHFKRYRKKYSDHFPIMARFERGSL